MTTVNRINKTIDITAKTHSYLGIGRRIMILAKKTATLGGTLLKKAGILGAVSTIRSCRSLFRDSTALHKARIRGDKSAIAKKSISIVGDVGGIADNGADTLSGLQAIGVIAKFALRPFYYIAVLFSLPSFALRIHKHVKLMQFKRKGQFTDPNEIQKHLGVSAKIAQKMITNGGIDAIKGRIKQEIRSQRLKLLISLVGYIAVSIVWFYPPLFVAFFTIIIAKAITTNVLYPIVDSALKHRFRKSIGIEEGQVKFYSWVEKKIPALNPKRIEVLT